MPPKKRNRKRVPGSWRDQNKGDCFTVRSGAVVCEGSAGMNYKATKYGSEKKGRPKGKPRRDTRGKVGSDPVDKQISDRRKKVRKNFADNLNIESGDVFYNKKTGEDVIVDNIQVKDLKLLPRIVLKTDRQTKTGKETLTRTAFRNKYTSKKPQTKSSQGNKK